MPRRLKNHCAAGTVPSLKRRLDAVRYGSQWQAVRDDWLALHPVCHCNRVRAWTASGEAVVSFGDEGMIAPAVLVDHVRPLNSGGGLLDLGNLQSLCARCHALKTQRFG